MPPITESEQLHALREEVGSLRGEVGSLRGSISKISLQLDMVMVALKGNTDIDPTDSGLFGKLKWLTNEVMANKRWRARMAGMVAGGVAVGTVAGSIIGFLITKYILK